MSGCTYCGVTAPECLVECQGCHLWFCNGKTNTKGSHIIMHMTKARHHQIKLSPANPISETDLECYNCGGHNIFSLGFTVTTDESTLVFLCRQPCLTTATPSAALKWKKESWKPLISEFSLVEWLAHVPPKEDQQKVYASTVDSAEAQVPQALEEQALEPLPLVFESCKEFARLYTPLIDREAEVERLVRSQNNWSGVHVTWLNSSTIQFMLGNVDFKITVGDNVMLECPLPGSEEPWTANAIVLKATDRVTAKVSGRARPPKLATGFRIKFQPNVVTKVRMKRALGFFAKRKYISPYLKAALLGGTAAADAAEGAEVEASPHPKETALCINGVHLNESQLSAVNHALSSPLALIQGPPGTGKTVVSTAIISLISKRHRVMACAPSNIVVDQLAAQLGRAGVNVVRMVSLAREVIDPVIEPYTLNYQVRQNLSGAALLLLEREERGEVLGGDEQKTLEEAVRKEEGRILNKAQVVCCTCSSAGDWRLLSLTFKSVLIDESTQATEPESLIPLIHRCQQLVLVGDHKQLGPVVTDMAASKAGLSRSFFERLVELGNEPARLTVQYRMHPSLSRFPSSMFYDGSLQNSLAVTQRTYFQDDKLAWLWPVEKTPMMFWATMGQEEIGSGAKSYLNQAEASNTLQLVTRMISSGVSPSEIGIITPYEAQRTYMRHHFDLQGELSPELYSQIEIESVDAFQGREKGVVILSCVRSNESQGIGFLKDPRRLNVAITRAQYGLVVVGNPRILSRNAMWSELIEYHRESGCLVQGTLNNLRPYTLPLSRPKKRGAREQEREREPEPERETFGMERLTLNEMDVSHITQLVDG